MTNKEVNLLIQQANDSAGKGDWQAAYKKLLQASGLQPDHTGVINGIGLCLIQFGKFKEAINYFEQLATLVPNSQDVFCSLGMAYEGSGELALSEETYLKALQINPKNIAARKGLAIVYLQQGVRYGEGIQILSSLVKTNPEDIEAALMLANCYEQGKNILAAKNIYQQTLEKHPRNMLAKEGLIRVGKLVKDPTNL